MLWPEQRQVDLTQKIQRLVAAQERRYCYLHPPLWLNLLPQKLNENPFLKDDCNNIVPPDWIMTEESEALKYPCFYIITAHGSDISKDIWKLRSRAHPESVFALWHWDNHVSYNDNFKSALAVDLNFISHNSGVPGYLTNPISAVIQHIPLCCVQFGASEIRELINKSLISTRSNKSLFNYVVYENAPRAQMMRQWEVELAELAEFKLMPSSNRERYWNLSREDRFKEWSNYKSSVIIPLVQDLSTRVFDALATGQIPIIPEEINDFDTICPKELQNELGIVRIKELTSENLKIAIQQAVLNFDRLGVQGIINRSQYVLNQGMIGHRIKQMLSCINAIDISKKSLTFGIASNGIGCYIQK